MSLLRLSAGSFAQKGSARGDRRRDAYSRRCPALPSRQQRSYTLVAVGTPRRGDDSRDKGGGLDPAALEQARYWNGHLASQGTAAIPRDQNFAGTTRRASRTSPAPRHLV